MLNHDIRIVRIASSEINHSGENVPPPGSWQALWYNFYIHSRTRLKVAGSGKLGRLSAPSLPGRVANHLYQRVSYSPEVHSPLESATKI